MRFLYFKKGSYISFGNTSLGYSRNCVIEIADEVSIFENKEIPYPVDAKVITKRVNVSVELLDFEKYYQFINQVGVKGQLKIKGVLIGKGTGTFPVGKEIEFILYNACLTRVSQLNLSEGAFPQFEFTGLFDMTQNKMFEIKTT